MMRDDGYMTVCSFKIVASLDVRLACSGSYQKTHGRNEGLAISIKHGPMASVYIRTLPHLSAMSMKKT